MGVYLPNVDMPKDDKVVTIQICPDGSIWQQYRGTVPNAKAVHVPPHGRLIDADAPIEVWEVKLSDGDSCSFRNIETTVSKFLLSHLMGEVPPTIIPAEEGK